MILLKEFLGRGGFLGSHRNRRRRLLLLHLFGEKALVRLNVGVLLGILARCAWLL